jgi:hypothetical protein
MQMRKKKGSLPRYEIEHQHSVNDCWSCTLGNLQGNQLHVVINKVWVAYMGKTDSNTLPAPSIE